MNFVDTKVFSDIRAIRWWRGLYFHYGILATGDDDIQWVYEISGEPMNGKSTARFEMRQHDKDDFEICVTVPQNRLVEASHRLYAVEKAWNEATGFMNSPYNLFNAQCEHVARFIVDGKWYSQQSTLCLFVGVCAILFPKATLMCALRWCNTDLDMTPNGALE